MLSQLQSEFLTIMIEKGGMASVIHWLEVYALRKVDKLRNEGEDSHAEFKKWEEIAESLDREYDRIRLILE